MEGAKITDIYNPASSFGEGKVNPDLLNVASIIGGGTSGLSLIALLFFFLGLAFFGSLSLAAYNYISSEGDPAKIAKASSRISMSVTGLLIAFAAFLIVRLVAAIFGIGEAEFIIPN